MKAIKPIPYQCPARGYPYLLIFTFMALLLTACGGGGGSSSQNTITSGGVDPEDCVTIPGSPGTCGNAPGNNTGGSGGAATNSIIINASNAAQTTNAVLGIIDIFYNLGERQGIGSNIITAAQNTPATTSFSLAGFAIQQLAYMAELDSLSLLNTPMVVGIHTTPLVPCATGTVVNLSTDPTTINARFTDCDNAGTILNGDLTISEFSVDPNVNVTGAAWTMGALFTFTGGLSISDSTTTIEINSGAMRFSANADITSSGMGLILVEQALGISINNQTETIQNGFILAYDFDPSTSTATEITVNGNISRSTGSTSALQIATSALQPLRRFSGGATLSGLPPGPYDSGRLRITSSDSSNVTLDILSSTDVLLDINDGAENPINLTWADLLNS